MILSSGFGIYCTNCQFFIWADLYQTLQQHVVVKLLKQVQVWQNFSVIIHSVIVTLQFIYPTQGLYFGHRNAELNVG